MWIREVINEMHKEKDVKLVCDLHDLDSVRRKFIPIPERELFNASDAVVYVSLPIQESSNKLHKYTKPNIALFHYCNEGIIDYDPNLINERKGLVYQGGANPPNDKKQNQMFQYRNLHPIMKRIVEMGNEVHMFCGNITAYDTYQDTGAILYPPTQYDEMMEKLTHYKYGLAIFNNPNYTEDQVNLTLTNKMFEYLMCGLPTIASWCPETEKYIEKWNIGFTFKHINDIGNTAQLSAKYQEVMDNIAKLRKELVMERFIWKLENLYAEVLGVEKKQVPDDILELSKKEYGKIEDFLISS